MEDFNDIPYDLTPDDDTEEMEPREYRPLDPSSEIDFPDWGLLPEIHEVDRKLSCLGRDESCGYPQDSRGLVTLHRY